MFIPALSGLRAQLDPMRADIHPGAREIAQLAAHDGLGLAVSAEQALPVYVRDNVVTIPGVPTHAG